MVVLTALVVVSLTVGAEVGTPGATSPAGKWTFVSFPDFFNFDVPNPQPKWDDAVDWFLSQVEAENPDFVLIAGDLVNGHWWDGPAQIENLGNAYYGGWVRRMRDHGLRFFTAIGDHELGDDPWPPEKTALKPHLEQAYATNTNMPANGPPGFEGLAYYVAHKNLLLVTVETFETHDGEVRMTVSGDQLAWTEWVLRNHPGAEFVIVQGHVPILPGCASRSSSRLMLEDGRESALWRVMAECGVDAYFAGEHHAITASEADGVWQVVHGASWGRVPTVNYLLGTVEPGRMTFELKRIPLELEGGSIWNINKERGPREIVRVSDETKRRGFERVGRLVIEGPRGAKRVAERTGCFAE